MNNSHLKIDDSLIISRLQYKELLQIRPDIEVPSQFFPLVTTSKLVPFFNNLGLNLGLEIAHIGDMVIKISVDRGYAGQDLEDLISRTNPAFWLPAIARLDLRAPIFYQVALIKALEALHIRQHYEPLIIAQAIPMELARISHHVFVIKNILFSLGLYSLGEIAQYLEQLFANPLKSLGNVQTENQAEDFGPLEIIQVLDRVEPIWEDLAHALLAESSITKYLQKKCLVTLPMAGSFGLSGLFLRATGHHFGYLQSALLNLYPGGPKISLARDGDALARFLVRISEIKASLNFIKSELSTGKSTGFQKAYAIEQLDNIEKKAFSFGEVEGPEGTIKVGLFVRREDQSIAVRIRTPAFFIAQAIPHLLRNEKIRDLIPLLFSLGIRAEEVDK